MSGFRAWGPALFWAAVLFGLSSIPGSSLPEVPGAQTDKLVHAVLYTVLGVLVVRGLKTTSRLRGARAALLAAALSTVYGITDELHQLFTPRRSSDWHDVIADAVGGLLGGFLATATTRWLWRRGKSRRAL
jgi:VanZ family protein